MFSKLEMDEWEDIIRQRLVARKKELGLSDVELGKIAFGDVAKFPKSKISCLLVGQGAGNERKPQNIRAADLMNLCEALRLSWYDVMNEAHKQVKERK